MYTATSSPVLLTLLRAFSAQPRQKDVPQAIHCKAGGQYRPSILVSHPSGHPVGDARTSQGRASESGLTTPTVCSTVGGSVEQRWLTVHLRNGRRLQYVISGVGRLPSGKRHGSGESQITSCQRYRAEKEDCPCVTAGTSYAVVSLPARRKARKPRHPYLEHLESPSVGVIWARSSRCGGPATTSPADVHTESPNQPPRQRLRFGVLPTPTTGPAAASSDTAGVSR